MKSKDVLEGKSGGLLQTRLGAIVGSERPET